MAKKTVQIYVRAARDFCLGRDRDGVPCTGVQADHGFDKGIYDHPYVTGSSTFVYPTDTEKRKIYEQLKEEFDA